MQHDMGSSVVSGIIVLVLHCSYLPYSCRSSCPLNHMFLKSGGGSAVSWSQWRSTVKWYRMPFSLDVFWLKLLLQICMNLPLRSDQVMFQSVASSWLALDTIIYRCSCEIISFKVASFHQRNACPQRQRWESRAGDYMGRWYAMHKHMTASGFDTKLLC